MDVPIRAGFRFPGNVISISGKYQTISGNFRKFSGKYYVVIVGYFYYFGNRVNMSFWKANCLFLMLHACSKLKCSLIKFLYSNVTFYGYKSVFM